MANPESTVLPGAPTRFDRPDHDMAARITELLALRDGWLDGEGTRYPAEALTWVLTCLTTARSRGVPSARIYPALDGEVIAEWSLATDHQMVEVRVDFQPGNREASLIATDVGTRQILAAVDVVGDQAIIDLLTTRMSAGAWK